MIYEYKCVETDEIIEKEFPMDEDHPEVIEEDGKKYKRLYRNSAIHIPYQWGDTSVPRLDFEKSPSGKKHIW